MISGKDINGALHYNEHKVQQGKAKCIQANLFLKKVGALTMYDKVNRFMDLTVRNRRTKTNTVHISLNFAQGERLEDALLRKVASSYMDKIGFGNQPFLVYRHDDAAHPHIHIVTTNIQENGKRIPLHNIGRNQSEKARKEIERDYGLVKAEGRRKQVEKSIRPVDVAKAVYGKSETRRSISHVVRTVTTSYKYASLPELNSALRQFNVMAYRGTPQSKMYANKGLLYSLIDDQGNRMGIPVKASALYGKPTMAFLEKQYELNKALRKPHREKLKATLDKALQHPEIFTPAALIYHLQRQGVYASFRTNPDGRTYGVTFVDNRTKTVFKGSDLGKMYGAKGILEKLSSAKKEDSAKPAHFRPGYTDRFQAKDPDEQTPETNTGKMNILTDLLQTEQAAIFSPEATFSKKKRRRKRKGKSL